MENNSSLVACMVGKFSACGALDLSEHERNGSANERKTGKLPSKNRVNPVGTYGILRVCACVVILVLRSPPLIH